MFALFREKRIARYEQGANDYVSRTYEPVSLPHQNNPNIRYSLRKPSSEIKYSDRETVQYSLRGGNDVPQHQDRFCPETLEKLFSKFSLSNNSIADELDDALNMTFVDMLTRHINMKGWRDSKVYKVAQIDRRLFSKIMSDREYYAKKVSGQARQTGTQICKTTCFPFRKTGGFLRLLRLPAPNPVRTKVVLVRSLPDCGYVIINP